MRCSEPGRSVAVADGTTDQLHRIADANGTTDQLHRSAGAIVASRAQMEQQINCTTSWMLGR